MRRKRTWIWILLIALSLSYILLILFIILWGDKLNEKKASLGEEEPLICPHSEIRRNKRGSSFYFLNDWECDYCGFIIKKINLQDESLLLPLIKKHLKDCGKAKKIFSIIDAENKKNNVSIYDDTNTLKKKGYVEEITKQIESWGLINKVRLPNLKEKKRKGVVNILVTWKGKNKISGSVDDLVAFLTPSTTFITSQNLTNFLNKNKLDFFYTSCGDEIVNLYDRVVGIFFVHRILQKKLYWDYNIYLSLVNKDNLFFKWTWLRGESKTLSLYLSLLSAYYQKPISQEVAATGLLDIGNYSGLNYCFWCLQEKIVQNPEEIFSQCKISPVDSLEHKIPAAVKAGVKKLILSSEQQANYERVIPAEVREKLKVYYVKNVEELERLFWDGEFS